MMYLMCVLCMYGNVVYFIYFMSLCNCYYVIRLNELLTLQMICCVLNNHSVTNGADVGTQLDHWTRKEGHVLFNDALNTFYLRLYGVRPF